MKKINFICHGNICRSPMAEFIMKTIVHEHHLDDDYLIVSCATSYEEIGNDLYYKAKEVLNDKGIPFIKHKARHIKLTDFTEFDYLIAMDDENIFSIQRFLNQNQASSDLYKKVFKLKNFINQDDDIDDPWYSRDFDKCFNEIYECCLSLFMYLEKNF